MELKDRIITTCQSRAEQWRTEAELCKAITDAHHAEHVPAHEMTAEQTQLAAQAIADRISAIAKAQEAETIADILNELFEKENQK